MRLTLTGLLGVATCATSMAATAAAAAPAPPPAIAMAVRHYAELIQMQRTDDRCHWLDATSRVALDATVGERRAWLRERAPQSLDDPSIASNAATRAKAVHCEGGNKNPDTLAVRFGAWQMRVTWALRAQALLDGPGRPAWFAEQSPVLSVRKALDDTLAALNEKYGTSIAQNQPEIEREAAQMLATACPNKPHQCPAPDGGSEDVSKRYAQAWLQETTRFANALAKDPVKLPPPPAQEI